MRALIVLHILLCSLHLINIPKCDRALVPTLENRMHDYYLALRHSAIMAESVKLREEI